MDDESRDVSKRLSKILQQVGVSERIRQLRREKLIKEEIQHTIVRSMIDQSFSVYIFGSSIEGTTTPGMNSDTDLVYCDESLPVIDDIQQAPTDRGALLAISCYNGNPGYVKLQLVDETGNPSSIYNSTMLHDTITGYDNMGRVCLKHQRVERPFNMERNGPADTLTAPVGGMDTDMLYAFRSRTYPPIAKESLLECTKSGWLTMKEVEEMMQYGCLYVGVGHPVSDEKHYEWRISFSLQERKLMFRLNPTQRQCYVLLKLIKSMLTSEPNIGKSITSYHCKTCLFRVINKTRADQWIPENLISCTFQCLTELLQCLRNGDCPHFFIKTNNMFERRVYGEVKTRLIHHLSGMINEGCALFYRIRCDGIDEALRGNLNRLLDMDTNRAVMTFDIYMSAYSAIGVTSLDFGTYMKRHTLEDSTRFLYQQLYYLSSVNTITEHTQDETKATIRELKPILHSFYAANLASFAFSIPESKHRLLKASARHLQHTMSRDLMSERLLHGTILYRQGNLVACCDMLEELEETLQVNSPVRTLCSCYCRQPSTADNELIWSLHIDPKPEAMMKSSVTLCTMFLPFHTAIIPTALQYEFYRSVATPPGSRKGSLDEWFYLAVVDCKVYLFFMQYLVYSRLDRPLARRHATDNLLTQLLEDPNLGHRETGYNLLGWIYSQEGRIETAARCFFRSWRIRPHHNAAKWHMLVLIYQQYVARR